MLRVGFFLLALVCFPLVALAHPGHGMTEGAGHGFFHALEIIGYLCAALVVGWGVLRMRKTT